VVIRHIRIGHLSCIPEVSRLQGIDMVVKGGGNKTSRFGGTT
jgi:hypothetical protein